MLFYLLKYIFLNILAHMLWLDWLNMLFYVVYLLIDSIRLKT